jgi:NTE family protein
MSDSPKERRGTGVVFSSGFFGFFAHAGVLSAVRDSGIHPTGFAGSSSGAIVAAMAACGMPDEKIQRVLFDLRKGDFWDPDPPGTLLRYALRGFRGYTGYLKGKGFERLLETLPVRRIEECSVPLLIAATDLTLKREAVLTRGELIPALHASGAVPGLFKPARVGSSWCVDGGIVDKAPVRALAEHIQPARILVHFLPSGNVSGDTDGFLSKRFTPWHVQHLGVSIARQAAYDHQVALAESRGIEIVEIRTSPPSVSPNRLHAGPNAYAQARQAALEALSRG